jgi:hypothetical protein
VGYPGFLPFLDIWPVIPIIIWIYPSCFLFGSRANDYSGYSAWFVDTISRGSPWYIYFRAISGVWLVVPSSQELFALT